MKRAILAVMVAGLLAGCVTWTPQGGFTFGPADPKQPHARADNFVRGYTFDGATGIKTGANLEDLVTLATFASGSAAVDQSTITVDTNGAAAVADAGISAVKLGADIASTGLVQQATGALQVVVDESTLTLLSAVGTNMVKDAGITGPKLAADVGGDGLTNNATSGALDVRVDGSTIELSGDALRVKDDGITAAKLNSDIPGRGILQETDGTLSIKSSEWYTGLNPASGVAGTEYEATGLTLVWVWSYATSGDYTLTAAVATESGGSFVTVNQCTASGSASANMSFVVPVTMEFWKVTASGSGTYGIRYVGLY